MFTKYSMNKQSPEPQRKLPQTSFFKEERKEEQKKKRSRVAPAKKDNKVVSATKEGEAEKAKEAAPAKPQQPSKKRKVQIKKRDSCC